MTFESINPTTGEWLMRQNVFSSEALSALLERADTAQAAWGAMPLSARLACIEQLETLLRTQKKTLAALATLEMGKKPHEALAEIEKSADLCRFFLKHAPLWLKEERILTSAAYSSQRFEPLGLAVGVMPWNFPYSQILRFALPALITGNGCLIKPAPNVPQCSQALETLMHEAGFPKDSYQTLWIEESQLETVIAHPAVGLVSVTGSPEAGAAVAQIAGTHLKRTLLELGGSDPFIVLEDAPLNETVQAFILARFTNAGQACVSAKRLILIESIAEAFIEKLRLEMKKLMLAPLAKAALRNRLHQQVCQSIEAGAVCCLGGEMPKGAGFFYPATLLDQVPLKSPAAQEELFGPVASIFRVQDEAAALHLANQSPYALGGSIWSADRVRAEGLARQLKSGYVCVNSLVRSHPALPFGGNGLSGYGRLFGREGLLSFVNIQALWVDECH